MKKKIILVILFFLLLTLAFVIKSVGEFEIKLKKNNLNCFFPDSGAQGGGFNDSFFIGALNTGQEPDYNFYDSLKFNLWCCYRSSEFEGWIGYVKGDTLYAPKENYADSIKGLCENNLNHGMRTLLDRTKITYLGYGARSDYQCEDFCFLSPDKADYWFYTYTNEGTVGYNYQDNSAYGNGVHVKYCTTNGNQIDPCIQFSEGKNRPGYVVKGLRCNREQVAMNDTTRPDWIDDYLHKWYVKPRIRIDSVFAANPVNRNILVCRIEVVNWDGDIIRNVDLRVKNFLNDSGLYNGSYLETYRLDSTSSKLEFGPRSCELNPQLRRADNWQDSCHVDFRVWWYGNCDMWIDYVRVEDEIAGRLLGGEYDSWLQWEAEIANSSNGPLQFYIEEWEFNNLLCMKYISNKLNTFTDGKCNLMVCLNYGRMFYHIPPKYNKYLDADSTDIAYVEKMFIDSLAQKQIYTGHYPIEGDTIDNGLATSPIPVTLCGNVVYDPSKGFLTKSVPCEEYEKWLQDHLDSPWYLSYTRIMKVANTISKNKNIPFVNLIQTHLQYIGKGAENRREPTNEEMRLMVNLGLSYGAKGAIYFWYWHWGNIFDPSLTYSRGFTANRSATRYPRYLNIYGEPKWEEIKNINTKLHKLGPYFISFNNIYTNSYNYKDLTERENLINNTCFLQFITLRPYKGLHTCDPEDMSFIPAGFINDCQNETYLQISTFQNLEPFIYFMVVNRRCSPYKNDFDDDSIGGRRNVRVFIRPDFSGFAGYDNWLIVDVETGTIVDSFSKDHPGVRNLGWFMPGEGKLFKICPVTE